MAPFFRPGGQKNPYTDSCSNLTTARKKYTVQMNLDQNSSSHVSCDVIGFV